MQFILIGYDGTDKNALERRLATRDAHLANAKAMRESGKLLYAVAMVNESDNMNGSVMVFEFENRKAFDEYLKNEPYIKEKVWKKVEVKKCKVAPIFL